MIERKEEIYAKSAREIERERGREGEAIEITKAEIRGKILREGRLEEVSAKEKKRGRET